MWVCVIEKSNLKEKKEKKKKKEKERKQCQTMYDEFIPKIMYSK